MKKGIVSIDRSSRRPEDRASAGKRRVLGECFVLLSCLAVMAAGPVVAGAGQDVGPDPTEVDRAGWRYVEIGNGGGEWIVASAASAGTSQISLSVPDTDDTNADVEAPQWPADESDPMASSAQASEGWDGLSDTEILTSHLAEDYAGWERIEMGDGSSEWVVRSSVISAADHIDGDMLRDRLATDDVLSESPANMGPGRLALTVLPRVVTTGGAVEFSTDDATVTSLQVRILDITGRLVFASGERSGRALRWTLRDGSGFPVSRGIYFYTVSGRASAGRVLSGINGKLIVLGGISGVGR